MLSLGDTGPGGSADASARPDAHTMLRDALKAGVGCFDTAPFYSFGLSERGVGDALRGARAVLSTEVGRLLRPGAHPDPAGQGWPGALPFHPMHDRGCDAILWSFEDNLRRLGRERIDVLCVHDVGALIHGAANAYHRDALTARGGHRTPREPRDAGCARAMGLA